MSAELLGPIIKERFDCPNCNTSIVSYDPASSGYYACPSCEAYIRKEGNQPPKVIHRGRWPRTPEYVPQVLPLGTQGVLPDGLTYRVTGYMARKEAKPGDVECKWGEYMLFGLPDNYAQLAVYEGHWMFIKLASRQLQAKKGYFDHGYVLDEDERYDLYNKYSPVVMYAEGEFDWDIRTDNELIVHEFIAAPYMLVSEAKGTTITWYNGEYMKPKQVASAFGLEEHQLPWPEGVGAIEPAIGQKMWPALRSFTLLMALLVAVTQLALLVVKPQRQLLSQQFSSRPSFTTKADSVKAAADGNNNVIVTPSFQVDGPAALAINVHSVLDNQWLEIPATLINERTGQSYEFTKSLEYYHGYESGESWSEGSSDGEATLGKIPTGRYHLNLYPATEIGQDLPIYLTVFQHTPLHSNAVLLLLVLAVYPGILYWWRQQREQRRWSNSDYGPESNN